MPRSSNIELMQRVDSVYRLLLEGWTPRRLIPYITRQWGVKSRQARNYIYKAQALLLQEMEDIRKAALNEAIAARRELRRLSADPRFKLELLQDEARLLGLYTERHHVEGERDWTFRVVYGDDAGTPDPPS